jgi:hypothetical protein
MPLIPPKVLFSYLSIALLFILLLLTKECLIFAKIIESKLQFSGKRTFALTKKLITADKNTIYNKICDIENWSSWFSLTSKFTSEDGQLYKIQKVKQTFRERFGLFDSSEILWEVNKLSPTDVIKICSKSSKNTFGWDDIEVEFNLAKKENNNVLVTLIYSWKVSNPLIALVANLFIPNAVLNDCKNILNELCSTDSS